LAPVVIAVARIRAAAASAMPVRVEAFVVARVIIARVEVHDVGFL
jgi:hypothetical protein